MSDDKTEELKRNILSPSQWIRILYMAFYAVACWVLSIVLLVIVIAQILISLITGNDNENLRTLGKKVSDYFHEMLDFLVYATHDKPWPFAEIEDTMQDAGTAEASPPPSGASDAGGDDVFADISFTENTSDDDAPDTDTPDSSSSSDADDNDEGDAGDRKDLS